MKLYERLGVDKHSVRGMGIVISSLKQDDAADSSHSSPSKLSAWLGKDKTKSSTSWNSEASVSNCEVLFDQSNSGNRVTFAVQKSNRYEDDVETANLTALNLPTSDASSNSMPTFSQLDEDVLRELPNNILNDVKLMYQRDQRGGSISQGKASDRTNVSVPMPGPVSILHGGADNVDSPRRDSALLNDGGTFFVPSMSQIDIDEVMELPPSIREEILHQIGKRGDNAKKNDYIVQSTNQPSSKTKRACQSKKEDKSILVAGQVSVKRMLKLASIKTGKEQCCSFPLSQLSCLPLETQLQIANSDDIKIAKKVHKKFVVCDHEARVLSNQHISSVDHANESSSDSILDDNLHTTQYTGDSPKVFFQENIAPLKDFISSNPNPGSAEVSAVKEFLSLCVHEKRYDDSVTLLRAIKNMKNGWNSAIYNQLRTATGDEIFASSGSRLDLAWLGL